MVERDDSMAAAARLEQVLTRWRRGDEQARSIYTQVFPDTARREAAQADQRREAGRPRGPLDGLLVSLKASIDVAGFVTDACSPLLAGQPPAARDAPVVERLRRAGAVIVGRTQMTELAFSGLGLNPHHPLLRNPRDPRRVTGGSSSGAGASVAAGLADLAIGGDTGGSIRIPAALCGVTGFKPGQSRVPTEGAFPLSTTLDCLGPLADSVAACRHAYAVLADREPMRSGAGPWRLIRPELPEALYDEPVRRAFEHAMAKLSGQGAQVERGDTAILDQARADLDAIAVHTSPELYATLRERGVTDLSGLDPMVRQRMAMSAEISAIDYVRLGLRRKDWMARIDAWWPDDALIALPTVPTLAPLLAELPTLEARVAANARLLLGTRSANLLDLPALSLPLAGAVAPVGLMLVGPRGSEDRLLDVAEEIEAMLATV